MKIISLNLKSSGTKLRTLRRRKTLGATRFMKIWAITIYCSIVALEKIVGKKNKTR